MVIVSEENGTVKDLMFISKLIRRLWLAFYLFNPRSVPHCKSFKIISDFRVVEIIVN